MPHCRAMAIGSPHPDEGPSAQHGDERREGGEASREREERFKALADGTPVLM